MEYTKEEKDIIEESFRKCRLECDHELDLEDQEDVIWALNRHKDRYFMNPDKEAVAMKIFEKFGLWKDGRATIKEHDQGELRKKVEQTIRLKEARKKQLDRLKELQSAINESIQKVESTPKQITDHLYEKRKKLQAQAYDRVEGVSQKLQDHLKNTIDKITEDFNKEKMIILNDLQDQIEQLKIQEKREIDAVIEEYDSLMKLKQEYTEIEQEYQEDVEKLEIETEQTDANLFDLTVRELKEIATNKGLEYSARIVKADLVDLIENNDNEIIFEE